MKLTIELLGFDVGRSVRVAAYPEPEHPRSPTVRAVFHTSLCNDPAVRLQEIQGFTAPDLLFYDTWRVGWQAQGHARDLPWYQAAKVAVCKFAAELHATLGVDALRVSYVRKQLARVQRDRADLFRIQVATVLFYGDVTQPLKRYGGRETDPIAQRVAVVDSHERIVQALDQIWDERRDAFFDLVELVGGDRSRLEQDEHGIDDDDTISAGNFEHFLRRYGLIKTVDV